MFGSITCLSSDPLLRAPLRLRDHQSPAVWIFRRQDWRNIRQTAYRLPEARAGQPGDRAHSLRWQGKRATAAGLAESGAFSSSPVTGNASKSKSKSHSTLLAHDHPETDCDRPAPRLASGRTSSGPTCSNGSTSDNRRFAMMTLI